MYHKGAGEPENNPLDGHVLLDAKVGGKHQEAVDGGGCWEGREGVGHRVRLGDALGSHSGSHSGSRIHPCPHGSHEQGV